MLGHLDEQGEATGPYLCTMKQSILLFCLLFGLAGSATAQEKLNPIIAEYGGIYAVPSATVRPDSSLDYRLVIDVMTGSESPAEPGFGLNNVARMLNLHAVGGVPAEQLHVVLAIHGGATVGVLDDSSYRAKFGVDNPNAGLIRALKAAGVRVTVCGQSLLARNIDLNTVLPEVEVATSMLTTVATYQMKGYAVFKF